MFKKIFISISLLSLLLLAGCNSSNEPLEDMNFDSTCGNDYQMETQATTSGAITPAYVTITSKDAKDMMNESKNIIILDVRTKEEYEAKHIPGAILLPNETITEESVSAAGLSADNTLLVYCRSGRRSKEASQKLVDLGFSKVYDFGGINDWPYETE